MRRPNMYFIAKHDINQFPIKKALGKKRVAIVICSESALENPQNTASLRLKSRLAEKAKSLSVLETSSRYSDGRTTSIVSQKRFHK